MKSEEIRCFNRERFNEAILASSESASKFNAALVILAGI